MLIDPPRVAAGGQIRPERGGNCRWPRVNTASISTPSPRRWQASRGAHRRARRTARDRIPEHAVIAPAVHPAERVDRHELDEVDAEIYQIVELLDRGVERADRSERADVQLVVTPPSGRPCQSASDHATEAGATAAAVMDAIGLARGAGVGQHFRVVDEDQAVAGVGTGVDIGAPQPSSVRFIGYRAPSTSRRTRWARRPHCELRHRARSGSATGNRRTVPPRAPAGEPATPECGRSRHRREASTDVSPQPVLASRTVHQLRAGTSSPQEPDYVLGGRPVGQHRSCNRRR